MPVITEWDKGARAGLSSAALLLEESAQEKEAKASTMGGLPDMIRAILRDEASHLREHAAEIRAIKITRGR